MNEISLPNTTDTPAEHRTMLTIVLVLGWVMTLFTFSVPGREAPASLSSLDVVALAKVGSRGVCLLVFSWILMRLWSDPRRSQVVRRLWPLALFAVWCITSTLWSPMKAVSLGQAGSIVVLLLMAINLGILCRSIEDLSRILRNLATGLLVITTLVLIATYSLLGSAGFERTDDGAVVHPTDMASIGSLGLLLIVIPRLLWNWPWARRLLLPGLVMHGLLLFLASNRLSMALNAVLLLVLVAVYLQRAILPVLALAGSLAVAVFLAVDPGMEFLGDAGSAAESYASRGQSDEDAATLSGRTQVWEAIWEQVELSPWIGHGYFVSSDTGELDVWGESKNWSAHNMVLQVWVTTGIVGLALFGLGCLALLLVVLRSLLRSGDVHRSAALFAAIATWFFGWGLLNASVFGAQGAHSLVAFALCGLTAGGLPVLWPKTEEQFSLATMQTKLLNPSPATTQA